MATSSSVLPSSSFASPFLLSNIGSLISIKLENHNYLLWKLQFLPVLRANNLEGFVDGSYICPLQFFLDSNGNVTHEINPQYFLWFQQDQNVLCWINATLSASVLAHVVGLITSRAVRLALGRRFASLSHSHIIQLKTQLQTIKKGSSCISDYIQKIKHISDSLATVLCPVDMKDLIIYTLNGLPLEYGPFKTSIRTGSAPITIEELHVLLLCEELNLEATQQSGSDFNSTALIASKDSDKKVSVSSSPFGNARSGSGFVYRGCDRGKGGRNNSRGRENSQHTSNSQTTYSKPCCQICNRTGHLALDCYHRMDYSFQGRHPPTQLAAMAASFNPSTAQNWYADSGATNHITNDLQNLFVNSSYQGNEQVAIGNGQG